MFRLPEGEAIINRFGFNNLGLEAFISNLKASDWVREKRGVLGLNIGKNASTPIEQAADDYLICLEALYPWADYITVNISSPNTKNLRGLQSAESLTPLLEALKRRQHELTSRLQRRVPLFLKVAPDLDEEQILGIAKAVNTHEFEGLIATNTTLDRSAVAGLAHAEEAGGLSGAPLTGPATSVLRRFREALLPEVALVGVGGILSPFDGLAKRDAGADLVQVYSGLVYRGPRLVADLANDLAVAQPG
jgi:dihydroorotate dehydrogenase